VPVLSGPTGRCERRAADIEKRGYRIAALSYDPGEIHGETQYLPGSRAYGVPRPIIFVLDRDGVIKAKLYEESFKVRPPVTAVISTLDALAKGM
jgi:peroxiredoxin